jgi:ABC-type dipeptide/oligopeptide/nickel transport system permease subunit
MANSQEITNDVRSWLQQGLRAAHAGEKAEARRYFQEARNLDQDNIIALLWLAWLAPSRRESLTLFCRVLELDPGNKRAQAGIEWVRSQIGPEQDCTSPARTTLPAQDADIWTYDRRRPGSRTPSRTSPRPAGLPMAQPASQRPKLEAMPTTRQPRVPAKRVLLGRERIRISTGLRAVLRRVVNVVLTLLVILLMTLFGLIVAERGQERVPARPLGAASEALNRAVDYVTNHPTTYYWHREEVSSLGLVSSTLARSGMLLLLALAIATLVGVPLGIAAALSRRERGAPLVLFVSILGISTPSFLLAMLIGVLNILIHRRLGTRALPPTGFGWDAHLVMPALVLAARPLAQIVQITHVSMLDILGQDYIRVAQAKGLGRRIVINRHALRNALVPILTTLTTSLRWSLASLPVVEFFFVWPGVGLTLLLAIEQGVAPLVADLILSLGLVFLLVNLALDLIYPMLDPRLGQAGQSVARETRQSWRENLSDFFDILSAWWKNVRRKLPGSQGLDSEREVPKPLYLSNLGNSPNLMEGEAPLANRSSRRRLPSIFGTPVLLIGALTVAVFLALVFFGEGLTQASPYQTHGVKIIDGVIGAPPFPPSTVFPWGTDPLGRDLQALVLAGARQTLTLAFFAMVARMAVGTLLGMLGGWWRGGRFDRLLISAIGVWAAFPVTLFAIIAILALGIEKGLGVFVVVLCFVGWAEIAQFVRGQVISIKPQLHIEAARALGTRTSQILNRHVLPLLLPSLLVLAALEMGGVLMLLAELGFLNIFLGGGFKVQIAETGRMVPVIAFYSDIPEWGALLANIRDWWRAYPWLAWYPGIFFFAAILAFNLLGEGLRRWLDRSRVNVSRLFSRYTLAGVAVLAIGLVWMLRGASPMGVYSSQAKQFDVEYALEDIQKLASPQFQGRETGTPGAEAAAEYIAGRMKEIGLQTAGQKDTYLQTFPCPWYHLTGVPSLEILDEGGDVTETLVYREDFAEYIGPIRSYGEAEGTVVGLVIGPDPGTTEVAYHLAGLELEDKVILVPEAEMDRINPSTVGGILVVSEDPSAVQRKQLFPKDSRWTYGRSQTPALVISKELAERLLGTTGSNLAGLEELRAGLGPGEVALTDVGATVRLSVVATETDDPKSEECYNVIGFIPGSGSHMESGAEGRLNSQVIMVHAYYDGLGIGPDGTLYPGANDNASGVATMLEMARVLNQGVYEPKKTVVFVAWTAGERGETMSVRDVMNAKLGFNSLTVEAVIELSGVGAGEGKGIALGDGSSHRLVQVFQEAANRVGVPTTTRGRGPHFDVYVKPNSRSESALPAYVSWDGSDHLAHTSEDTFETIDPQKLEKVGQTTLLALTVLSREVEY